MEVRLSSSLVNTQHFWLSIADPAGKESQSRSQKTTERASNKKAKESDFSDTCNAKVPEGTADLKKALVLSPFLDPDSARSAMNGRHAKE